jgi:hypothetical protein
VSFAPGFFAGTRERYYVDRATGSISREVRQDAQGVLDAVAAVRADGTPGKEQRYIGSVPIIQAQVWAVECGAAIGTKEYAEYVLRKLADPDYAKLRGFRR